MKTLTEFMDTTAMYVGMRRDLDIRPLAVVCGLNWGKELHEVYSLPHSDFYMPDDEQDMVHSSLKIPKGNSSLDHFGGAGSTEINNALWENYKHSTSIPNHIASHIAAIHSILHAHVDLKSPIKLYTGLPKSPAAIAGMEWNSTRPKKILHLPAFTSTTTDLDIAHRFTDPDEETQHHESDHHGIILPNSRHILQLNFNHQIKNAASIYEHVGNKHEKEILLGPRHEFELNPRPTHLVDPYSEHPTYLWVAHKGAKHLF